MPWRISPKYNGIDNLYIKANTRPSIDVAFAATKSFADQITGKNVFTFTRSSTGTYRDFDGLIKNAAANQPRFEHDASGNCLGCWIEESRTNAVTSSIVDNVGWTTADGATITPNAAIAPDGQLVAALVSFPGSNSPRITRSVTISAGAATQSIWIRAVTGSVTIRIGNNSDSGVNQTIGTTWTRITQTTLSGGTEFGIYAANPVSAAEFYAWGAQTELGETASTYIPAIPAFNSRASVATSYGSDGLIRVAPVDIPRSNAFLPDPNGIMRSVGLLIEGSSVNLLNWSETFATSGGTQNNWVDTNITRVGSTSTSPSGVGTALRVSASGANGTIISSASIGSTGLRVFSIFLRRVSGSGAIQYTLDNGTTWTTQAISPNWLRYSFLATNADQQVGIRIQASGDVIELWGAQLENSSYSTSYIPSTNNTATRAADVLTFSAATRAADNMIVTGGSFASWYNQVQGTVFLEAASSYVNSGDTPWASFSDGSTGNYLSLRPRNTIVTSSGVQQTSIALTSGQAPANTAQKIAWGFSSTGASIVSGTNQNSVTSSVTMPVVTQLEVGKIEGGSSYINGPVARFVFFRTRLSDAVHQTMTT